MSHYIYVIAIMFRYALWLSITNHYLNLYHFRSKGHFGPSSCCTICSGVKLSSSTSAEICEWKKMLQKVHQNWTTAQKHWYLKHLQFMRWFISLLGAKHFERRKCGHPDVLPKTNTKAFGPTFSKMWHEKTVKDWCGSSVFPTRPSDDVHLNTRGTSRWRKSKKSR